MEFWPLLLKIQAVCYCLGEKVFIKTGSKTNSCEILETAGIYLNLCLPHLRLLEFSFWCKDFNFGACPSTSSHNAICVYLPLFFL